MVESRESRVERQEPAIALRSCFPALRPRPSALRPSFTLIELLISILIISILAAALLGVAAVASESAREAKTRTVIARLHTLLMEQHDSYKSRRVTPNTSVTTAIDTAIKNLPSSTPASVRGQMKGQMTSEARLYALREMMLMEMPDRWSDVVLGDPSLFTSSAAAFPNPLYLPARTELSNLYLRQYQNLLTRTNTLTLSTNTIADIEKNQSAECLYMIIMNATGDGEAKSLFAESSIGDTDGDGAPEFLDGWGHPISFLRWAPGFYSDVQLSEARLAEIRADAVTDGLNGDDAVNKAILADHDPFDLFRVESNAVRLVPLIYSAGRDDDGGLIVPTDSYFAWLPSGSFGINPMPPYLRPQLTPFAFSAANAPGTVDPANNKAATDNIHNHLIGTR